MMSSPLPGEVCSWCATRDVALGRYEITWAYDGQRDKGHGYYICIKCKNWIDDQIQDKTVRTFMKLQARAEKPCCGGGG